MIMIPGSLSCVLVRLFYKQGQVWYEQHVVSYSVLFAGWPVTFYENVGPNIFKK